MTALHSIQWIAPNRAQYTCSAEPGTECKLYPTCDCEDWLDEQAHNHSPEAQLTCWKVDWLEAQGNPTIYYTGDLTMDTTQPRLNGFITTSFVDDYIQWDYDQQPAGLDHLTPTTSKRALYVIVADDIRALEWGRAQPSQPLAISFYDDPQRLLKHWRGPVALVTLGDAVPLTPSEQSRVRRWRTAIYAHNARYGHKQGDE